MNDDVPGYPQVEAGRPAAAAVAEAGSPGDELYKKYHHYCHYECT